MNGKVLTFFMGGNHFGIDILAVKEINRKVELTRVPDAPSYVAGLLNMRGQVVTLINLGGLMGYELEMKTENLTCIILKNSPENQDYAGFLIDHPGSVVDILDENCEPPPANIAYPENKYIREVAKVDGGLLMIINYQEILKSGSLIN
ncbi:MAG: chemotaxis protein CheW [Bacillota bacterium]